MTFQGVVLLHYKSFRMRSMDDPLLKGTSKSSNYLSCTLGCDTHAMETLGPINLAVLIVA